MLLIVCEKSLIFRITLILFHSIEALETKLLPNCEVMINVSFLLEILKHEYTEYGDLNLRALNSTIKV